MNPGFYKFLADALVLFHFSFVGFVLLGGAIVLRWRRAIWLHLPAVAWGIYIELSHNICPLTPLENRLRWWGGGATYQGSFVDHYIMPVLYPSGLTHNMQVSIACIIVVLNAAAYGWMISRRVRGNGSAASPVLSAQTETVESPGDTIGPHRGRDDGIAASTSGETCRRHADNGSVAPERAVEAPSVQVR